MISSVKPEVVALGKFYREESPYLYIPSIQRQFVWDTEDIKELIDSIINGYPIGSVIIWEPTTKFPSVPLVGGGNDSKVKYILDGGVSEILGELWGGMKSSPNLVPTLT
jgi:hypothetical protein